MVMLQLHEHADGNLIVICVDWQADVEQLAMISIQLVSKFLFTTGFRTKKTVRYTQLM